VPLFDVARSFATVRAEAIAVFERLLDSGRYILGPELREFEERFAAFCGSAHCVGVSDGTAALQLALSALGVEPGDEVLTVPNTFVATVEAIDAAGARPRLVDVDPRSRCMDVAALESALDGGTAAVVPVHLFGRLAAMAEITRLCSRAGVAVLEDAAQAHGASLDGRRAGAWGDVAAFSFYPTKNLGAAGDGGAVVSHSAEIAAAARSLRHHGSRPDDPNHHERPGHTARLDNLQAALLSLRLAHLDEQNDQRRAAALLYRELLAEEPVVLPQMERPGERQVFHLFVIEVEERDRVLAELRDQGIAAAVHYPTPIHLQPAWRSLGYARGDFPVAERLAERCLSLPIFPGITEHEQVCVANALAAALP
jgi:dTDP-4-amino-4,6-dideoxygalactose transaminase